LKNETRAAVVPTERHINWSKTIFLSVFHLGAVAALWFWSWPALVSAVLLYWVTGSLGVGMGYHRLLTHRGYKVPKAVEYFLVTCASMSLQGGPIEWTATHRMHHAHTDKQGDPHTPREGRFWSHMGWIVAGTAQKHEQEVLERYVPDLLKDRYYVWLSRYYWVPLVLLGAGLLALGGWQVMMWSVFLRVTVQLHATWLVNSATHLWGRRRFETNEDSRNSWWVALLTFGEGWHNNHHAHPTSARHGLKWYEIDFNWWGIRLLQFLGLARAIKRVRFNTGATMWQLVSGDGKTKGSYEGA
jgi:stearoyl-CoA desaturase (delta-9 desaturase)